MATIKLQPSGNVLIKDSKVSCACCCGCFTSINGDLLEKMRNATTGTCNGSPANFFNAVSGGFFASFQIGEIPNATFYTCSLSVLNNCFSFQASNFMNEMHTGLSGECCPIDLPFPITCADVIYTINAQEFNAHTENTVEGSDITPPNFIFL